MTKTEAIAKFAEAYMIHVAPNAACLDKNVALSYAIQDLLHQVRGQKEAWQIDLILDEADYIAKRAA